MNDIMMPHDNNNKAPLLFVFFSGAAPNFLTYLLPASNSVQLALETNFARHNLN